MYLCAQYEVPGMLEHPIEPEEDFMASSWRLPETKHLCQQQGVEKVDFDQCTCGAPSRKSTTLMSVAFGELRRAIRRLPGAGRCFHTPKYHAELAGVDEDGNWLTTAAKEYPPKMCQAVAVALDRQLRRRFPSRGQLAAGEGLDPDIEHFFQPLDPYLIREIGLDFHDAARQHRGPPTALQEAREWAKDDAYVPPPPPPPEGAPRRPRVARAAQSTTQHIAPHRGEQHPTDSPQPPRPLREGGRDASSGRFSQGSDETGREGPAPEHQ